VTTPAPRQATASWPVISPRGLGVGVTHLVHLAGSYRRWRARHTAAGGVVTGCSGTSWFCYIGPAALRPGRTAGGPRRCCWRGSCRSGWRPEGLAAQTPADPPRREQNKFGRGRAGTGAASVVRPGSTPCRCWDGIPGECPMQGLNPVHWRRQPNPLRVLIHWVKTRLRSWLQILPSLRRRPQCCALRDGASPA
jgi:hypothetical protein